MHGATLLAIKRELRFRSADPRILNCGPALLSLPTSDSQEPPSCGSKSKKEKGKVWVIFCHGNAQHDGKSNLYPVAKLLCFPRGKLGFFFSQPELKENAGRRPEPTHPLARRVKMAVLTSKRILIFMSRQKSGGTPSSRQAAAENLTFSGF